MQRPHMSLVPGLLVGAALTAPLAAAPALAPLPFAESRQEAPVEPGYLGVSYTVSAEGGVAVTAVRPGTPAERAKLQAGDVVVRAGGREVLSAEDLLAALAEHGPGSKLTLGVRRGDETLSIDVVPTTRANPGGSAEVEEESEQGASDRPSSDERATGDEADAIREALRGLGYIDDGRADTSQGGDARDSAARAEGRGFLGVFPATAEGGVRIDSLVDGGAAQRAGLRAGDVIVSLDGRALPDAEALRSAIDERSAGAEVSLVVRRGDQDVEFKVELTGRDGDLPVPPGRDGGAAPPEAAPRAEAPTDRAPGDEAARRAEEVRRQIEAELRALEQGAARGADGNARPGAGGGSAQDRAADARQRADRARAEAEALRQELEALARGAGRASEPQRAGGGRAFLGVQLDDLTVSGTLEGGGAQRAGVRAGDTIRSLDGESIESLEDLRRLLQDREPGSRVVLGLDGDGGTRELEVVLGRAPEEGSPEPSPDARPEREPRSGEPRDEPRASAGRGVLGVGLEADGDTVRVARVFEGTPAAEAGLRAGDVVVRVGGFDVHSTEDLSRALGEFRPGQRFPLVLEREGERVRVEVALATRDEVADALPEEYADALRQQDAEGIPEVRAELDRARAELERARARMQRQLEAEQHRREAEQHQREAEQNRREAEQHQREAEQNRREAERNQRNAEQNQRDAEQRLRDMGQGRSEAERGQGEADRLLERFSQRRDRELRLFQEQAEQRMQALRRDLEAREQALEAELENVRRRLGELGDGSQRQEQLDALREELRRWRAGNQRALDEQVRQLRERARSWRAGGDGDETEARARGQRRDPGTPGPDGPEAMGDGLRETLRALRSEVEALRGEVRRLRAEVGAGGG